MEEYEEEPSRRWRRLWSFQSGRLPQQILLLQLDLIEQQQQQLQAKEKEIEELKSERDTVREGLICVRDEERVVRMLGGRGL